jgi:prophage regulatory protein
VSHVDAVRILRPPTVRARLGVSTTTLYRWVRQGLFPRPLKLGPRLTGWPEATFDAWVASRDVSHGGRPEHADVA